MTLQEFTPENALEDAILDTKRGRIHFDTLFGVIADLNLLIPSKTKVEADFSGFSPLLLENEAAPFVAAFSSLSRPAIYKDAAAYVLQMNGRDFVLRLPPQFGIMLNPGYVVQMAIPRETVADLKQRFRTD